VFNRNLKEEIKKLRKENEELKHRINHIEQQPYGKNSTTFTLPVEICIKRKYVYNENMEHHAGYYVTYGPGYEECIDESSCIATGKYCGDFEINVNGKIYNVYFKDGNKCMLPSYEQDRLCRDIGRINLVGQYDNKGLDQWKMENGIEL